MYLWCLDCSVHVCPSVTITRQSVQAQIIRYKTGLTEAFKAARLERSVSYWEFKLHLRGQLCSQTLFIITTHIKPDQLDRLFLSVQWTKQTSQYVPITTQISPVKLLYLHVSLLSRVYPASLCCYLFSFWIVAFTVSSPSHLSLPTARRCISGVPRSLRRAVPVGSLVSHPDLGHLLTRSQRSATLRLKQLHPSREFPLRAAIIIADRHAKKLQWICSAQAVTFQQTAVIFRSLCLVRCWWSVVIVLPSCLLGGIMVFAVCRKLIISC